MKIQSTDLENKWQKLEEEIKDFQKSFKCSCEQQTVWSTGEKVCKHLLKKQKLKFNRRILEIVNLEITEKSII